MDNVEIISRLLCQINGEQPDDWLDYADIRNDVRRWEYFQNKAKRLLKENREEGLLMGDYEI